MNQSSRCAREVAILRTLVSLAEHRDARLAGAVHALRTHRWSDEENRVVYECLRSTSRGTVTALREEMAAEAVRAGHPDVEWGLYFGAPSAELDVLEAIRNLNNTP